MGIAWSAKTRAHPELHRGGSQRNRGQLGQYGGRLPAHVRRCGFYQNNGCVNGGREKGIWPLGRGRVPSKRPASACRGRIINLGVAFAGAV